MRSWTGRRSITGAVSTGIKRVNEDWKSAAGKDYEPEAIDGLRKTFDSIYTVGNDVEKTLAGLLSVDISGVAGYSAGRVALAAYFSLLLEYIIAKKVYVELSGGKVGVVDRLAARWRPRDAGGDAGGDPPDARRL